MQTSRKIQTDPATQLPFVVHRNIAPELVTDIVHFWDWWVVEPVGDPQLDYKTGEFFANLTLEYLRALRSTPQGAEGDPSVFLTAILSSIAGVNQSRPFSALEGGFLSRIAKAAAAGNLH